MLTLAKSSHSSQLTTSSLKKSAGFSSEVFNHGNTLSSKKSNFHNRSSAAEQNNSLNTISRRSRQVNLLAVLRGQTPVVTSIIGNGTRSTQTVQQMHNRGRWAFYSNGRFQFTPNGLGTIARTDLFPIVGNYNQTNNSINFYGSRRSSNLTSRNLAEIKGTISVRNGRLQANFAQRTVTIMAAVVNGTSFGQTIDRTVVMRMNMVRIA